MVIRIQTILGLDTFINVLVDRLNKLNKEQVNDILIDALDDVIPESEDNINENYIERLKHVTINLKLAMVCYVKSQSKFQSCFYNNCIRMARNYSQLLEFTERPHYGHLERQTPGCLFIPGPQMRFSGLSTICFYMHSFFLS